MFRSFTRISTCIVILFYLVWIAQLCFIRKSDLDHYKANLEGGKLLTRPLLSTTHQNRKQVRKDIWFSQADQTRLQHRIDSQSSLLTLEPSKNQSFEVIEHLQGIICRMQEKLYVSSNTPMQQLRIMEAKEGIYRYQIQNFTADAVTLSLFRLPGQNLSIDTSLSVPFLQGNAQGITFSVDGNTPQFQAHNFKASLKQIGGK